ncbi:MAG: CBS domain-containing protein [Candidatus Bathycorpusculaceae bacterium]
MHENKEPPSIVRSVMAKPVITVEKGSSVYEVAKLMSEKSIGSIVVLEKGKPVGIATERDILQRVVAKGLNSSQVKIEEIMSRNLITISGKTPIINAIRVMEKNKVRRLLVMEKGKLVGIVTQRDLLRALAFHVVISFRPLL